MHTILPAFVAFIVSLIVNLLILRYEHLHAHITADYDMRGVQKFHASPVPRIGGVGIFGGILCSSILLIHNEPEAGIFASLVLLSSIPAFLAGLIEDLTKRVSVSKRLIATACSAFLGCAIQGVWLIRLDVPGFDYFMSFSLVSLIFTCFSVTGVANSFNLIDGYNGLAGTVAVIILAGLAYVAGQVGDIDIMLTSYLIAGSIIGFLIWNYPNGLIFLGDGGAYVVGFLVAELSVLLVARNDEVSPWFPLLLVFYPIFETLFTIFRRVFISKTHPGLPDAAHLHQLIYTRVVRWAVGDGCLKKKTQRNALTSPYLWAIASFAVIPAVIFWKDTQALQFVAIAFAFFYTWTYRQIYKSKVPRWLTIQKGTEK